MPLILVMGRGGQGRVLLDAALAAGTEVAGILDDEGAEAYLSVPVIGTVADWRDHLDLDRGSFAVTLWSHARAELGAEIAAAGGEVASIIHPGAYVSAHATVGRGVGILNGVTVHPDAALGDYVIVNANSSIDHDCQLATGAQIGPGVTFPGHVTVGEFAQVGAGVVARPGITIGAGATVGAGSVVVKDIPEGETWAGNPARAMGARA